MTFIPLLLLLLFNYETKFILRISGFPKLNFIRSFFWKIVGKKIFLVTTPTKLTRDLLNKFNIFEKDKVKYLPDPVLNFEEYRKKNKEREKLDERITNKNSLISIGRLTYQKNFSFLINSFKEINKKYSNFNLFIIGEGEERNKLKDLIQKNNLDDKVFLLGYKKNIFHYLKNSNMFILTSLWEDPGFVLVEAALMNKIVLSSNCPNGPKELLENEKNGFLFNTNSTNDFLRKFDEIQNSDKDLLLKKRKSFKKKIKEFTLINHYKILVSLIL